MSLPQRLHLLFRHWTCGLFPCPGYYTKPCNKLGVHQSYLTSASVLWRCLPSSGVTGSYGGSSPVSLRPHTVSWGGRASIASLGGGGSSPTPSPRGLAAKPLEICCPHRCEKVPCCRFDFLSLLTSNEEHFVLSLQAVWNPRRGIFF